jgi:hypothetical protein
VCLFLLDRHAVGAEIDAHALELLAVLIELIPQDDDNNHQRADDEIDDIAAIPVPILPRRMLARGAGKAKGGDVARAVRFSSWPRLATATMLMRGALLYGPLQEVWGPMDQIDPEEEDFFEGLLLETCRDHSVSRPRVRPTELLPGWLRVEFPRDLRERNPIGTLFRANVHVRQKHYSNGIPKGPLYLRAETHSIRKVSIPSGPRLLIARQQPGTISGRAYEYSWVNSASESQQQDFYRLRERAYQAAVDRVGTTISEAVRRERNRLIADYALRRANGICEACEKLAPFLRRNDQPYPEIHHIVAVASGGADSPLNVAAVSQSREVRTPWLLATS